MEFWKRIERSVVDMQESRAIETTFDFDQVDWERYIKRWLLYAYRYIPSHRSVDAKTAEDLVFQAIDAVISGRRRYARPNIFADSSEPDHQGPFFVYVCGVIRALSRSCYQQDSRIVDIDNYLDADDSHVDQRSDFESLIASNAWLERLEQKQQLDQFKNYLARECSDSLLCNIVAALTDASFSELNAKQKANYLCVSVKEFNNALKRLKRILNGFLLTQDTQKSSATPEISKK